ncbi:MAG: cysteine methyltransferase [Chloroflexi bacterium]|nr:cysteine methyltransferase [Chloroflexota bacterium]
MYALPDPIRFNQTVYLIVRQIPAGQVATYGQIASMIPTPDGVDPADYDNLGARWVGEALDAISGPDEAAIPWQRVINSRGGISMSEQNPAAALQRARLRAEGSLHNDAEVVDLAVFGWGGPDADWLRDHDLLPPRPIKRDGPTQLPLF